VWVLALLAVTALAVQTWQERAAPDASHRDSGSQRPVEGVGTTRGPVGLPPEALATLAAIERGGPYRYRQDGRVFENRERLLPLQPRGYYREYTVDTPGSPDRGARRIVTGGDPPEVFYYTDDHYRSFKAMEIAP
jgi:guanyl-specific ribonuclease Sa